MGDEWSFGLVFFISIFPLIVVLSNKIVCYSFFLAFVFFSPCGLCVLRNAHKYIYKIIYLVFK